MGLNQGSGQNSELFIKENTDLYTRFFIEKDSKDFVFYDQSLSLNEILNYYSNKSFFAEHPIREYGKFDIRELAVVIKFLYSLYYGMEYEILTFGYLEKDLFRVREGLFEQLNSNLCFLIGNHRSLENYYSYKNLFLEDEHVFHFTRKRESFVCLRPLVGTIQDTLGISCKGMDGSLGGICYYDSLDEEYKVSKYLNTYYLFHDCFYHKLENYSGIWDTLSFSIHDRDQWIAKALISIAIFKKNHGKVHLTNEDYRYIFYELFRDNSVNVGKVMDKEIPKVLKYVPKKG